MRLTARGAGDDDNLSWLSPMRLPAAVAGGPGSPPGTPLQQAPPPQALLRTGDTTSPGACP